MNVFIIEKDIPLPERRRPAGPGRPTSYPFAHMEIGDSFECTKKGVSSAARVWGKKLGRKFATRKTEKGVRVWRIA